MSLFRGCVVGHTNAGDDRGEATHRAVSRREKGPTMLSAALGILAMLPVVFGVAGYAMVSR